MDGDVYYSTRKFSEYGKLSFIRHLPETQGKHTGRTESYSLRKHIQCHMPFIAEGGEREALVGEKELVTHAHQRGIDSAQMESVGSDQVVEIDHHVRPDVLQALYYGPDGRKISGKVEEVVQPCLGIIRLTVVRRRNEIDALELLHFGLDAFAEKSGKLAGWTLPDEHQGNLVSGSQEQALHGHRLGQVASAFPLDDKHVTHAILQPSPCNSKSSSYRQSPVQGQLATPPSPRS